MNTNLKMLIGVIIGVILLFILPTLIGSTLAIILAIIYVGYAIGGNFKNGVFNGAIVGVILAIISWVGTGYVFNEFIGDSIGKVALILLILAIVYGTFGAIGGIIGIFIKRRRTSTENKEGSMGYLVCEECGGYYELQPGESPEDYEECECGGKLKYNTLLLPNNESEDLNSAKSNITDDKNKLRSFINFKNKKFLIIISILALTIIITPILYSVTTTPNYTLLGSYDASKINITGTNVTIPNGTKSIKIEYNLQAQGTKKNATGLGIVAYNSNHNPAYGNATSLVTGQKKTGTMIMNNSDLINNSGIMDILLQANGIQGKIKIYTSK